MVHALEKAASCLNQGGVILEVHDLVDPPRIEVHSKKGEIFAGQLFSEDNFENQRLADQAINQVVTEGLLISAQSVVFESCIRADTYVSLTDYLDEEWQSACIPEDTKQKVIELAAQAGENSDIVLRMVTRLNLILPVPQ